MGDLLEFLFGCGVVRILVWKRACQICPNSFSAYSDLETEHTRMIFQCPDFVSFLQFLLCGIWRNLAKSEG